MNLIEQRIWDYLDGTGTPQQRELTEQLIKSDPVYQQLYDECKSFNDLVSAADQDEPSMGFTRNVMERINLEPVPASFKSLIDKRIIFGIAAFFLFTITALLGVLFYQIDWSQTAGFKMPELTMPALDTSKYLNSTYINIFLFVDIIFGLYLLDGFLRKRLRAK
ncbi:MAG: hypothetical protein B7X86_04345 [Sphingobacteriales bacterium 17-39-43]|uniref:hypothetical protein n=1 Tax=Daejeonella sp. TaxID=2805397 RepID=UPI000BDCBE44|nr:hypothetical protein [Daejeonella sp.]OYY02646.1 MAG: hypothetical protein B7Y76_05100 [Sphingobacteriia bacterium 35-40-5]OYZ32564.1 MAG: hypothetical protein B7Y24_05170 [Sphingobacteriales bacterium 16-39-50]OZA25927.1 MAG: hypothetical protein B7X86_04345 [Sphingobacteriales bacterium 17-39-43]OZA61897.1 MAG: hypothetical protein B7X75_01095 [Sphingobacteriales bacterium 39-40-5]HQS50537.1 hypothetical protein [Daejeonella sp.]